MLLFHDGESFKFLVKKNLSFVEITWKVIDVLG